MFLYLKCPSHNLLHKTRDYKIIYFVLVLILERKGGEVCLLFLLFCCHQQHLGSQYGGKVSYTWSPFTFNVSVCMFLHLLLMTCMQKDMQTQTKAQFVTWLPSRSLSSPSRAAVSGLIAHKQFLSWTDEFGPRLWCVIPGNNAQRCLCLSKG